MRIEKGPVKTDFSVALAEKASLAGTIIDDVLASRTDIEPKLKAAMGYALTAPGKRLRAAIVLWACEVISGTVGTEAQLAAAAVEMVHTYSLVHDDLPAMDDDDFRRGQPSCHRAFDEATAILAGDGLLTMAFELLADGIEDKRIAVDMISALATAAGPAGMIAGQMADMQSQDSTGTVEELKYIHTNKTAKMFEASARLGAIAAGASDEQILQMAMFGLNIGLGFQIADDILDITATSEQLGKTAGKDAEQGKVTYPAVVGMDESRRLAAEYSEKAIAALVNFGAGADILRQLAEELTDRTR